jgi:hypothetical protein
MFALFYHRIDLTGFQNLSGLNFRFFIAAPPLNSGTASLLRHRLFIAAPPLYCGTASLLRHLSHLQRGVIILA